MACPSPTPSRSRPWADYELETMESTVAAIPGDPPRPVISRTALRARPSAPVFSGTYAPAPAPGGEAGPWPFDYAPSREHPGPGSPHRDRGAIGLRRSAVSFSGVGRRPP